MKDMGLTYKLPITPVYYKWKVDYEKALLDVNWVLKWLMREISMILPLKYCGL